MPPLTSSSTAAIGRAGTRGRKELLGTQVENQIRAYIAERGLIEGDDLPSEGQIATVLGVSKSTVRESVRRLEALGHIRVVHGVGLRVGTFSIRPVVRALPYDLLDRTRGLTDILEVRTVIEENFLVRSAAHMTEEHFAALESIVAQMEATSSGGEVDPHLDAAFHRALYEPIDNRLVMDLISTFWELFDSARHAVEFTSNFRAVQEHREIVEALRDGDEQRIRTAIRDHFRQLEDELARFTLEHPRPDLLHPAEHRTDPPNQEQP